MSEWVGGWVGARYTVREGGTLNLKDTTLTPTRGYTSRDSLPCLLGRAVDLI